MSFAINTKSPPLIVESIGEVIYPALFKNPLSVTEPGLVTIDIPRQKMRRIILPSYVQYNYTHLRVPYHELYSNQSSEVVYHNKEPVLHLTYLGDSTVAAVDSWGTVRIIETGVLSLQK